MTQPNPRRPVPGPPPAGRPQPGTAGNGTTGDGRATGPAPAHPQGAGLSAADLAGRPVGEHVAVLEAEHARLQADLASIDRL